MEENSVHVFGRVKRDAAGVPVRKGLSLMEFCLVVRTPDGPDAFVDVLCMGDVADDLGGFVAKDEHIGIDGHLMVRTMTERNGRKRSRLMVKADSITYIEEE